MYCKKCQKYGKLGDRYCEDCGTKLEKNMMPMKLSKKTISIIVGFLVIIILFLGLYGIGLKWSSPSYIAEKYFKAVSKNDIDAIYSYLDREDNTFFSKELLKEKTNTIQADDYQIISVQEVGEYATVLFEYTDYNRLKYATVLLKRNGRKWLLFDNWEVDSAKVAENIEIKVLKGSNFTIDDKRVDSYKVSTDDKYYDTYRIPLMVAGTYQIKADLSNGLSIDKEVEISSNETYVLSYIDLEETKKKELESKAIKTINQLYSSAVSKKAYQQIENSFSADLETLYDDIKNNMYSNIQSIHFNDSSIQAAYLNEEGNLEVVLKTNYTLKVKNDNKIDTSYYTQDFVVEFKYDNSSFVLQNISVGGMR